ncbi:MAG: hypothetical protein AAF334_02575 [Pseudomonadota bacterium]
MVYAIYIGGAMAVAGLVGVLWCIRGAAALRRYETDPEDARAQLAKIVFVNMAAMGIAFLGLGLTAAGLLLR